SEARMRGVLPSASRAFTPAPLPTNLRTAWASPFRIAVTRSSVIGPASRWSPAGTGGGGADGDGGRGGDRRSATPRPADRTTAAPPPPESPQHVPPLP